MESKEEKFKSIIKVAFSLLREFGISGISISLLSKRSGISRGWIYKYVASDIEGVLKFCLKAYAEEFARFTELRVFEDEDALKKSILNFSGAMADRIYRDHNILSVYFEQSGSDNFIGDIIRDTDSKYLKHLAGNFELSFKMSKTEAARKSKVFHSMRMGGLIVFSHCSEGEFSSLKAEFLDKLKKILNSFKKTEGEDY